MIAITVLSIVKSTISSHCASRVWSLIRSSLHVETSMHGLEVDPSVWYSQSLCEVSADHIKARAEAIAMPTESAIP
jgi:hypothetical protein